MASPAQIAANRANAQHSTGPVTEQGKATSSLNALKHGFYSKQFIVADDEREEFEDLRDSLLDEVDPRSPIAVTLFVQLLHAAWNLHRVQRLEAELLNNPTAFTDPNLAAQLDRLARHAARFERSYHRALKALQEQVTNQFLRLTLPTLLRDDVPYLCSSMGLHKAKIIRHKAWAPDAYYEQLEKNKRFAERPQPAATSRRGAA